MKSAAWGAPPIVPELKHGGLGQMQPDVVRFEGFEYRRQEQGLFRGGVRLAVGSRALALLDALLRKPGTYISAAELMRSAWPDTYVEESNLRVQISNLRGHLGVNGQAIIRNAPGRGYAFCGSIDADRRPVADARVMLLAFAADAEPLDLLAVGPALRAVLKRIEAQSRAMSSAGADRIR